MQWNERNEGNKRFEFSWQFKSFEIRTVHKEFGDKDSPINPNCPIEIVKYFDDVHSSCYVIAHWRLIKDGGYELRFVGSRPFDDISSDEMSSIWGQLQAAQKMLDAYYEACQGSEEY